MGFGLQIFTSSGKEIVGSSQNIFPLERIQPTFNAAEGTYSRSFTLGPGETLKFSFFTSNVWQDFSNPNSYFRICDNISISGGNISWREVQYSAPWPGSGTATGMNQIVGLFIYKEAVG